MEYEFQRGIRNAYVRTYVRMSFQAGIYNMHSSAELSTASAYVRMYSTVVRTYMELRSLQVRKLIPAGNSTYVRIYVYTYSSLESAKLEHCGELSGIRICIFCCKVRVDWKWKIEEWKVVAFLFVYTVLTVRAMSTILKLTKQRMWHRTKCQRQLQSPHIQS